MLRLLFLLFLLAGCSSGPEADLQAIGSARSLGAEWALLNEQAGKGHLTSAYVQTMHSSIREQLRSSLKSLTRPGSSYALEIQALLREPDEATPEELRSHVARLRQIEGRLESA
jgi:hypothetical protein